MVSRPLSPSSALTSRPTVSNPAWRLTCAIPAPIVPRPTTPTVRISILGTREHPAEGNVAVARLVLDDHLVSERLESFFPHEPAVCITAERREEHRHSEPIAVDVLAGLAGTERREEVSARPEPRANALDESGLLARRYVSEEEQRHD